MILHILVATTLCACAFSGGCGRKETTDTPTENTASTPSLEQPPT